MMDFNINNYVKVKLTDRGRLEAQKQSHELSLDIFKRTGKHQYFQPKEEDVTGWSIWQMNDLIVTFGHLLHEGKDLPFELDIQIVESENVHMLKVMDRQFSNNFGDGGKIARVYFDAVVPSKMEAVVSIDIDFPTLMERVTQVQLDPIAGWDGLDSCTFAFIGLPQGRLAVLREYKGLGKIDLLLAENIKSDRLLICEWFNLDGVKFDWVES